MAEEYKNTVPEHETPKVATEESPATTTEVKSRGLFDFLKTKEEVKPQETTTLASAFENKKDVPEHETPKVATEESPATTTEVKSRGYFDFLKTKEEVKPQETTTLASESDHKNNVPEHETPKVATEESPATATETKGGMFDFLKKKEEVKPQETTTLASEFEHKTQISEPEPKHEEEEHKVNKPTLLEQLHQKHEEEEENKPSLLDKLHGSSSSSSSDEEGEDGEKRKKKKKEKKKIVRGDVTTEEENQGVMDKIKEKFPHGQKPEGHDVPVVTTMPEPHPVEHQKPEVEEKKGLMDKIKEKLPGHSKKPEDSHVVNTTPLVDTATPIAGHPEEKKGFMEKIKEKLPGHHAKTEEEKKEKDTY